MVSNRELRKMLKELNVDIEDNFKLMVLNNDVAEEYIELLYSEEYNRNQEFRFNERYTLKKFRDIVYSLITYLPIQDKDNKVIRLVLLDKSSNSIAGILNFIIEGDSAAISYYLRESYRGKGLAYKMSNKALEIISKATKNIKYFSAVIHEDNNKSLKLILFLGFEEKERRPGKYKNIVEFRRYINET